MSWIAANIGWVLVASGAATCSMLSMAVAPRLASRFLFGEEPVSASALLMARSWGAMIAASGLMLVYAAWHAEARLPILLYSIVGKLGFIVLVFAEPRLRTGRATAAALGDLLIVTLLGWYLMAAQLSSACPPAP
jgi:hypothetical protein